MTIRRHSDEYFDAAPAAVASAVRAVLARSPYLQTSEVKKDAVFKTNVKPSPWLLGTDMFVEVQASSKGTQVVAKTQSQWFILGDVFNFYSRYIQEFLRDLRAEVGRQNG